jgi:hypothetical protein
MKPYVSAEPGTCRHTFCVFSCSLRTVFRRESPHSLIMPPLHCDRHVCRQPVPGGPVLDIGLRWLLGHGGQSNRGRHCQPRVGRVGQSSQRYMNTFGLCHSLALVHIADARIPFVCGHSPAAIKLRDHAFWKGSTDNISVIVVLLDRYLPSDSPVASSSSSCSVGQDAKTTTPRSRTKRAKKRSRTKEKIILPKSSESEPNLAPKSLGYVALPRWPRIARGSVCSQHATVPRHAAHAACYTTVLHWSETGVRCRT